MVDVDLYSSTVPVLKMLETEHKNVLPRIFMYFDDILKGYECLGENIVLKEFNERNKAKICITPEGTEHGFNWLNGGDMIHTRYVQDGSIKLCHYFGHPLYNKFIRTQDGELPLMLLDL